MIEALLLVYAPMSLPSVIICFVGIAAIKYGFKRFGMVFKIQLWIVFLLLWIFGTLSGLLFGVTALEKIPAIALPVFFIGVLFWTVSLFFGSGKKIK